jgi:hypothetical protein
MTRQQPLAPVAVHGRLPRMTPKQAAARLILATLQEGAPHPTKRTREDMTTALGTRISDEKRAKILTFVTKIEQPFVDRLTKLKGEGDDAADEG